MKAIYHLGKYCIPIYNSSTLNNRRQDKDIIGFSLEFNLNNGILLGERDYSIDVNIFSVDINKDTVSSPLVETCYNSFMRHFRDRAITFKVSCSSRLF
jgi:hypothetical protein